MKKIVVLTIAICLLLGLSIAEAAKDATKATAATPKAAPAKEKAAAVKAVDMEKLIAQKKAELNNTQWSIELTLMSGQSKPQSDIVRFADDKVVSKNLESLGYIPSNFTLRIQDDGTVTWETMQTSEKDGVAFWRGDIMNDLMVGVLSKRDKKATKTTDYSFRSTGKTAITPSQSAAAETPTSTTVAAPTTAAPTTAAPTTTAPKTTAPAATVAAEKGKGSAAK